MARRRKTPLRFAVLSAVLRAMHEALSLARRGPYMNMYVLDA